MLWGYGKHNRKCAQPTARTVIWSLADAVCSNPPLTLCSVCSPIYACRLDQQQIKAEIVSSGSALSGTAPALADCWCMAATRPSHSHSSGTCCWRTHVEFRMSNSDFNCNKWSRYVIIQIFGEGDHYLPQMPLLFCVSICPEASKPWYLKRAGGAFV